MEINLIRRRPQLLEDSTSHLIRSGTKRMVFLFCRCNDLWILNFKGLQKKEKKLWYTLSIFPLAGKTWDEVQFYITELWLAARFPSPEMRFVKKTHSFAFSKPSSCSQFYGWSVVCLSSPYLCKCILFLGGKSCARLESLLSSNEN